MCDFFIVYYSHQCTDSYFMHLVREGKSQDGMFVFYDIPLLNIGVACSFDKMNSCRKPVEQFTFMTFKLSIQWNTYYTFFLNAAKLLCTSTYLLYLEK